MDEKPQKGKPANWRPGDGSAPDDQTRDVLREAEALLGRRIDALERDYDLLQKRSRIANGALGVLLLLTLVLAILAVPRDAGLLESVQSNEFVLRDNSGLVRAMLDLDAGGPRLVLRDGDARDRINFSLLQDGSPSIVLTDREGQARAVLGVLPDGTTNLVFADGTGRTRAVLGHSSSEATTLVLADKDGFTRAGLVVDASGNGDLTLWERGAAEAVDPAAGGAPGN